MQTPNDFSDGLGWTGPVHVPQWRNSPTPSPAPTKSSSSSGSLPDDSVDRSESEAGPSADRPSYGTLSKAYCKSFEVPSGVRIDTSEHTPIGDLLRRHGADCDGVGTRFEIPGTPNGRRETTIADFVLQRAPIKRALITVAKTRGGVDSDGARVATKLYVAVRDGARTYPDSTDVCKGFVPLSQDDIARFKPIVKDLGRTFKSELPPPSRGRRAPRDLPPAR